MGNSTVKAQRLANEANLQITRETNDLNRQLAAEQNELNYKMFNEQNLWNLDRRDEEWAYNTPSAQMKRYMEAGVNPLWAISGGNPGNAQPLTSADAQPAERAEMQAARVMPEADPTRLSNIVAASRDLVNSVQGFQKLALDAEDVQTRRNAQQSQSALNAYEAQYKRALSTGQDLRNAFDSNTFGTRVSSMAQNLQNMQQQYTNMIQEGKNSAALYDNIVATHDLIQAETQNFKNQCDFRLKQIGILQRQADIAQQNADTNARQVGIQADSLAFEKTKWDDQLSKWNNDEIFRWATSFSTKNRAKGSASVSLGAGSGAAGAPGIGVSGSGEFEAQETFANFDVLKAANIHMFNNCMKNPTQSNIQAYQNFDRYLQGILQEKLEKDSSMPSSTIPIGAASVLNPSAPWNQ